MIKVGDIVKLKNPKKREKKRRWKVVRFPQVNLPSQSPISVAEGGLPVTTSVSTGANQYIVMEICKFIFLRRLDTATHRLERHNESNFVPISFWEKLFKRY